MKYYLICGERSGDLHASNLIKALKAKDPEIKVRGVGGDLSKAAGMKVHIHYKDIAFMGFVEVFMNLFTIFSVLKKVKKDILSCKPDAIILVDFSGFNMKIAKFCKEHDIKVFYYISPKVWAWNTKRAWKIKKLVDHLFVILPFEKEFFQKFDYKVDYVGNPLRDAISNFKPNTEFLKIHGLSSEKKIVAILPGSRYQEVTMLLDRMAEVTFDFPHIQFVIAAVSNLDAEIYEPYKRSNVKIVTDETYDLLLHSRAAVVASGTATLETCLFNVPQVVCYRLNTISYWIAKVFYINEFFNELVLFSSGKDLESLDKRIYITDQATGIATSWKNTPEIWTVGKGNYKLRVKVSVCTEEDYYNDSIYVIVTETPCLTVQIKNLPALCKDETFDITPYIFVDDHLATSEEIADITFQNKSAVIPPTEIPLLNPTAINMTELVNNKTMLFPRIEMIYAPNVTHGICTNYTYTPPMKVPNTFPQSNVVFTYDNSGRQSVYQLEGEYYSFDNIFNKDVFKKLYIDNYAVHNGSTVAVYTDAAYQSPVTGNTLTAGTYYVLATNTDCNNDSLAFTAVIKERDFDIIWQAAPNIGQGYYTFDAPTYPGATYAWFAWSGSIVAGLGTNHITVYFSNNTASSPFVSCKITLNNARTTGETPVLGSAVYLTTNSTGNKEEITQQGIVTSTISSETTHAIYVYPNPAIETFAISSDGISDVKVYSTLGQLVYSNGSYTSGSPISIQSKGLHVAHIRQQGTLQTLKIVLQ